ncbi:MAG TPA: hypothetical protein VK129_03580 [Terriglobales bacterium]|nr:hypothetical protein [Terriglobales bacterium]
MLKSTRDRLAVLSSGLFIITRELKGLSGVEVLLCRVALLGFLGGLLGSHTDD